MSIDITAALQSYRTYEISCIGFVRGSRNTADGLKKANNNGALRRIINDGYDRKMVEKWIVFENEEKYTGMELTGGIVKKLTDMNGVAGIIK